MVRQPGKLSTKRTSISIKLQRVLFWTAFWTIIGLVFYGSSLIFGLAISKVFGTSSLTINGALWEGLNEVLTSAGSGAIGGFIWIVMRGERFGNLGCFFFWAVFWTLLDALVTAVLLMIYGLFSFNISFAIIPGLIGIWGMSREKQVFRQYLQSRQLER